MTSPEFKHLRAKDWLLDHVGHAVRDIDSAIELYVHRFGFELEFRETLPEHQVHAAFLKAANCRIELIAPLVRDASEPDRSTSDGPLQRFLRKRGEGLHHICYRVEDLHGELAALSAAGIRLIDSSPRRGAGGHLVAFIHPESCLGMLIELCQSAASDLPT